MHAQAVRGLVYHPTAEELLSASEDRIVTRTNRNGSGPSPSIRAPAAGATTPQIVLAMAYSHDGKKIAVAGENREITVYTLPEKQTRIWPAHDDVIQALVLSPDGKT